LIACLATSIKLMESSRGLTGQMLVIKTSGQFRFPGRWRCVAATDWRSSQLSAGSPQYEGLKWRRKRPSGAKRYRWRLLFQARVARPHNRLSAVGDLELAEDVRDMILHCLQAKGETMGDGGVAFALRDQVEDLPLPLG
jgi:hypothetical protein